MTIRLIKTSLKYKEIRKKGKTNLSFFPFFLRNISDKIGKTPLKYPGGKSRFTATIDKQLPSQCSEYRECFIGGGSVAIYLTKKYPDLKIWVNDLLEPLANFWIQLRDNGEELHRQVVEMRRQHQDPEDVEGLIKGSIQAMQNDSLPPLVRAVAFYIANRCSFSGLYGTKSMVSSVTNWKEHQCDQLLLYSRLIQNWKITNLDYKELLCDDVKVFVYLDPPYEISSSNLYGNKGEMHSQFDHDDFAENLQQIQMFAVDFVQRRP